MNRSDLCLLIPYRLHEFGTEVTEMADPDSVLDNAFSLPNTAWNEQSLSSSSCPQK